jgi:hypothetical protein
MIKNSNNGTYQFTTIANDTDIAWQQMRESINMGNDDGDYLPDWLEVEELSDDDIRLLRSEAVVAGDDHQVEICDMALDDDKHAQLECAKIIAECYNEAWFESRLS